MSRIFSAIVVLLFIFLYINQISEWWIPSEQSINIVNGYLWIFEIYYWFVTMLLIGLVCYLAVGFGEIKRLPNIKDNVKLVSSAKSMVESFDKPLAKFLYYMKLSFMILTASVHDWSLTSVFLISIFFTWMLKSIMKNFSELKSKSIIGEDL